MEKRNIFTSIFLWLVFFMIFLYGFYEIGGYCMSKSENLWLLFVILILVLFLFFVFLGIVAYKCLVSEEDYCDSNILYVLDGKVYVNSEKIEDVYIIEKESDKVGPDKKNVIVVNDVTLQVSMFENVEKIEKINFLSTKPSIDSELFEKIKYKIKYISSDKQILQIVFDDSKKIK